MARVVFMGTPEFAIPTLERLIAQHQVAGVVTQPDREAGRGRQVSHSPVKRLALAHGLPVLQPKSLRREPEAVERLRSLMPDVIVVAAYGLILPQAVLDIPTHGCLNVHASLLPKYRGASPIAGAILGGETETGITIMLMDAGMDTGPILAQVRAPIYPDDTTGTLEPRLARLGADLLAETLPRWLGGAITPRPQDNSQATYTRLLSKEDGQIDWTEPADLIARKVRAYNPWPGTYTIWAGNLLKILEAEAVPNPPALAQPGEVLADPMGVAVGTGEGLLRLKTVQLAGKRAMDAAKFARGARGFVGSIMTKFQ